MSVMVSDYTALDVLEALQFAMEAGANDESVIRLVAQILKYGPEPRSEATACVKLLVEAMRDLGGSMTIPSA